MDNPGHRRPWDRPPRSPAAEAENQHLHSPRLPLLTYPGELPPAQKKPLRINNFLTL